MGEALYRKYRSTSLDEVVGQEHVTTTLKNALKTGKISHAYLLTGPRGTGKTSIARILAHEVNDLPYSTNQHLDIIEIDAASNRRIDEVRDIRDKVRIAPTSAKYKVYIIDEVHMLTKEAFNALLKTLEEPPQHAIFILATTEVHKLPETIISRTQRYNLKPITETIIAEHLRTIAMKEKIQIGDSALQLIAIHSQGGLRDAISMFDQLSSRSSTIEAKDVEHMLGIAPDAAIDELVTVMNSGNPKSLLDHLNQLEEQGIHATQIAHQLSTYLHQELLQNKIEASSTLKLLGKLIDVPTSNDPDKALELTLLGYLFSNQPATPKLKTEHIEPTTPPEPAHKPVQQITRKSKLGDIVTEEYWNQILQAVKQRHNTLYSVIRMSEPKIEDSKLVLTFTFPFHQKRMDEPKNKQLIQTIVKETTGQSVSIICLVKNGEKKSNEEDIPEQPVADSATLETITDIFGGGEVLES